MSVWFTSDLHIGHKKVAQIRWEANWPDLSIAANPDYADRLTDAHDQLLATNWDRVVKPDDQVWVLGDISAGGKSSQLKALAWLTDRPGEKHLIPGNHDGVHPMHRDSHKWWVEYQKVFASMQPFARRNIPLGDCSKQTVLLSHFPYEGEGDRPGGDRFTQYRLRDEGLPVLHGHTHSAVKVTISSHQHPDLREGDLYAPAKQIHVGLDAWDFAPVRLEMLAELVQNL